ncbi:MAG: hypothetical protein ACXWRE_17020 [Pseudobdellovibrionaceae bacterium]
MSMLKVALVILIIVSSQASMAKLSTEDTQLLTVPMEQNDNKISPKDVEKIIPTDLKQTDDINLVAAKIADRSIETWFNSAAVQSSYLGKTAKTVQDKMATDITLKGDEQNAVEHKFSFKILALQAMAKVQYTGWLNAVFNYDAKAAASMVEFSDKVFNKDLFINHTNSSKGNVSSVGIKWGW